MKNLKVFLPLIGILILQFFWTGCNKTDNSTDPTEDPVQSKVKSDQAYLMIETEMHKMLNGNYSTPSDFDQFKFASALVLYNEAIALDPNNTDAQFGVALTEMLAAYSDAAINNLIKDIDSSMNTGQNNSQVLRDLLSTTLLPNSTQKMAISTAPLAAGLIFSIQTALKDPPLISRIQQVLRDNFLPKVQFAIDHLSKIEAIESFKFTISGKMQGDPSLKAVTIYPTEVALLNAMMHALKFNLQSLLIYKFDLTDYSQNSLISALSQNNTSFFVLQADGKQRAADTKVTFSTIITKMRKAIDYLERISGSKSDAVIKLGNNGIKQADLDTVKTYLTKLETALSSTYTFDLKGADTDGNNYTIQVNLGNFFANPPNNPKQDWLPAYSVTPEGTKKVRIEFNAATYADFLFPDPTLGGFLPNMPQETLKRIMKIDKDYAFLFGGYVNLLPYNYYSSMNAEGITVKITVNNITYSTVTQYWGDFRLYIREAGVVPQPITKITVTKDGTEYEMQNIGFSSFPDVQAKKSAWTPVFFPRPPIGLTATKLNSPLSVNLAWNLQGSSSTNYYWTDTYMVERKTGNGTFAVIPVNPDYSNLSAVDPNVVSGNSYTYRIRSLLSVEYLNNGSYDLLLVPKNIFYSNEVPVTP